MAKKRKKKLRRISRWLALLMIAGGGLVAIEVIFRGWFTQFPFPPIEKWRYETLFQQVSNDPRGYIHLPSRTMSFMNVKLATNSRGLRDRDFPLEKPDGAYRVLMIGNSTTLGWGVPADKTFAKLLEKELNQPGRHPRRFRSVEIINAGIGDYTVEQQLYSFLIDGSHYDPDAIILCFSISDAEATRKAKANPLTGSSYLIQILGHWVQAAAESFSESFWPETSYVEKSRALYSGQNWSRYRSTIAEFVHELQDQRIRLIPVLIPDLRGLPKYPFNEIHWKVASLFAELGFYPVDLLPVLESRPVETLKLSPADDHPNEAAHALIAKAISEWIEKRRLIR